MTLLLDVADADAVRAALGATVTSADVSDDMVMLDIFAGVASDRILEWRDALATASSIVVANDDPRLRRAATYLTAALIAPNVPRLLSERTPDYTYTAQALPADMLADKQQILFSEAYTAVARASGIASDALPRGGIFDLAPGGRSDTSGILYSESQIPGRLFW